MRNYLLIPATILLLLIGFSSNAQIVGTSAFLQGAYLEIGMQGNGSFGVCSGAPAGYHVHCPTCGCTTALAEVYDYGHDGWGVGAPAYMGDYTYPGSPFEGWEVQANGARTQGYQGSGTGYTYSGGGTMAGSGITSYVNAGGVARAFWAGTVSGGNLSMKSETRVDTLGSAVVVTVYFYNIGAGLIPAVYYWRSCDPDNDETWPGGGFATNNVINFQNVTIPNPDHKVEVTATGLSATLPPLTLCTKDCRAVACIYNAWPLTVGQDLGAIWNQTYGGAFYDVGTVHYGDIAIGVVWKIGDLNPGDSAVISYSYVFNGPTGVDSVGSLPDPRLVVNGVTVTAYPDTFNGCSLSGVDSIPVTIEYGNSFDWTWGQWTWSPSTGLASTTGINNFFLLNEIPGDITYTITGTDSGVYMNDCKNAQFIITIHSCHQAWSNNPCEGGTITLGMIGDSIGASYYWWGPGGFASTNHDPIIFPATMADTGIYHVVRTIAGITDTDFIHVMVHPTPVVTATSNIALCGPLVTPMTLSASIDSIGETFSWTGPFGFTSTLQSPTISPFDSSLQGTYAVTGRSVWGCTASASVDVYAVSVPYFTYTINRGCLLDTVYFNDLTFNASYFVWNFNDGDSSIGRDAYHLYAATTTNVFTVSLTSSNTHCPNTTWDTVVDTRHSVIASFLPTPDTFCLHTPTIMMNNSSTSIGDPTNPPTTASDTMTFTSFAWDYGNGATDTVRQPTYTYDACGAFDVHLTVTDSLGCTSTATKIVYVVQLGVSSFTDTMLCISMPLPMSNVVTVCPVGFSVPKQFVWTQNMPNLSDTSIQNPTLSGLGLFQDTLTISYPGIPGPGGSFGCTIQDFVTVDAVMGRVLTDVTASATIEFGGSIHLNADNEVIYYWKPDDGTLSNPNINDPIATPSVTTTYTVYGLDTNGCLDSAYVTVYVDTSTETGLPLAFTPNGDHMNDVFHLVGSKYDKLVEFRVFNRWGECVFMTNDRTQGWDGTYKGVPQDMGIFNYSIIIATPGGENIVYKGNLTLIR